VRPAKEQALRDLLDAIFADIPNYPGAHLYWLRIVFTLAHRARGVLRETR